MSAATPLTVTLYGWAAVHYAESVAVTLHRAEVHRPSDWDDAGRRPVTSASATKIVKALDHAVKYPVVSDDGSEAREIAGWITAHLAEVYGINARGGRP